MPFGLPLFTWQYYQLHKFIIHALFYSSWCIYFVNKSSLSSPPSFYSGKQIKFRWPPSFSYYNMLQWDECTSAPTEVRRKERHDSQHGINSRIILIRQLTRVRRYAISWTPYSSFSSENGSVRQVGSPYANHAPLNEVNLARYTVK